MANAATEQIAAELLSGDSVKQFRVEVDIVNQILRLFYHVRRIAKAVASN